MTVTPLRENRQNRREGCAEGQRPDYWGLLYGPWDDKMLVNPAVTLCCRLSALSIHIRASAPGQSLLDAKSQMADFAKITGIVGTITGTVALIVSIKSYVRVNAMKALDIRLELGKAFNDLDVVLSGIDAYLDFVHQSHLQVLAATGRNQSGEMRLFEEDFAKDQARLQRLLGSQPQRESSYERLSPDDLERTLTAIHAFNVQVADIRAKYQRLFDSDEECRKEIREEHRQ